MRVLVTGGDGFVGQHLITHMLAQGFEVSATSMDDTPVAGTLSPPDRAAVEWHTADVGDSARLERIIDATRPRRIVHLAGRSSSAEVRDRAGHALRVNAEGTLHLVEAVSRAARGADAPRVIVAGSADAYGRGTGVPIAEDSPLRPESVYGATKAAQEVVALGAGRALGVDVTIARLFPLVGPGQRGAFVLPSFCRRALAIRNGSSGPEFPVGNLDVTRDFTDVRDGVRAITALAALDAPQDRTYNVCSGIGTPVRRLLEWVLDAAEVDAEVVRDSALVREDEPESVVGDATRLRAATGWQMERDLRESAHDTFCWMAESDAM